jgi:glyoxylase-like metal-dependent hydrolase (beta-lactamase superfamily II)
MATIETVLQGFSLASNQGSIAFCGVTLVRGAKNTLVDVAHVGRRQLLVQRLAELGLTPNDIDCVFLTHAHYDHILNLDVFPNAQVLVHPNEREYVRHPKATDWATPSYITHILESGKVREVNDGEEIDGDVRVLATPGHSRGAMSLLVGGPQGTTAVCGDALPNSLSVATKLPRLVFFDEEAAKASIRTLLERARHFYPGHDRPFTVEGTKVRYLQTTDVRIFGWPTPGDGEGTPGLVYGIEPPYQTLVVK